MKILKVFGVVIAVHAVAFVFLASPGCNSSKKPTEADTLADNGPAGITPLGGGGAASVEAPVIAPAGDAAVAPSGVRARPSRPGAAGGGYSQSLVPQTVSVASGAEGTGVPVESPKAAAVKAEPKDYTVGKGDSLWTIAKKNGISVKELAAANGLSPDAKVKLGQKLVIPAKEPVEKAAGGGAAEGKTYTVKSGDVLGTIAKKNKTTVKAIMDLNGMKGDRLSVGQVLKLPEGGAVSVSTPVEKKAEKEIPDAGQLTHTVKPGEMLSGIAKRYGVYLGDLATLNNITDPKKLQAGQVLKIPSGGKAPVKAPVEAAAAAAAEGKPVEKKVPAAEAPVVAPAGTDVPAVEAPVIAPAGAEGAPVLNVEGSGEAPVIN